MTQTTPPFPPGTRTYRGSCRCGAVSYEVDMDLSTGTTRCNCTICTKSGWWGHLVKPAAFRLLSGRDRLIGFRGERPEDHGACGACGVRSFGHGDLEVLGGEFYSINLRCLDDVDLTGVRVTYLDGLHDTWADLGEAIHVDPFRATRKECPAQLAG